MVNLGGSWMGEFERIALEKGWNISKEARFKGPLAKKIQEDVNLVLSNFANYNPTLASMRIEEDGDFGPKSAQALAVLKQAIVDPEFANLYAKMGSKYNEARMKLSSPEGNAELWSDGLVDLMEIFAIAGNPSQRYVEMYKERTEGVKDALPGEPKAPEKPLVSDTMPPLKEVEVPGEVSEHVFNQANDKPKEAHDMSNIAAASQVLSRLVVLANDLDEMGAEHAALAVDQRIAEYKVAMDKLYDVMNETGESLIEMAHPGGGPTIVETSEEGGKVETIVEEHKKLVDKVTKAPTGKIASQQSGIKKEAFVVSVPFLLGALAYAGVASLLGTVIMKGISFSGDVSESISSIVALLNKAEGVFKPTADKLMMHLIPYRNRFGAHAGYSAKNKEQVAQVVKDQQDLRKLLSNATITKLINSLTSSGDNYSGGWLGYDKGKLETEWRRLLVNLGKSEQMFAQVQQKAQQLVSQQQKGDGGEGKYAAAIQKLIVKANAFEDAGQIEAAEAVDKAIRELQEVVLPFVDRSAALEAAGSEDSEASIKTAGRRYENLIPMWDKYIEFFDHFNNEIMSTGASVVDALTQSVPLKNLMEKNLSSLRKKFQTAANHNHEISSMWHKSTSEFLSGKIDLLLKTLNLGDETHDFLNVVFWRDKTVAKEVRRYEQMLAQLSKVSKGFASGVAPGSSKETATEKSGGPNLTKYKSSLHKLNDALVSAQDDIIKHLGSGDYDKGSKYAEKLSAWISSETKKNYNEIASARVNRELWNGIIRPLQKGIKMSFADVVYQIKKMGALPFVVNPSGGVTVTQTPASKPAGRGRRRPSGTRRRPTDENVRNLQQAMMTAGIKIPGRKPDDGIWGPNTLKAYNELRGRIAEINPRIVFPDANEKLAPSPNILSRAVLAATRLKQMASVSGEVEIAPGKTIRGVDMRNVKAFVAALVGNSIIENNDNMLSKALQVLKDFITRVKSDSDYKDALVINNGEVWFKNLSDSVYKLVGELTKYSKNDTAETTDKVPGDLMRPDWEGKANKPSAPKSQPIRFNPNDVNSIINAIQRLDTTFLRNVTTFKGMTGTGVDVKKDYQDLASSFLALKNAFGKSIEDVQNRSNGMNLYKQLVLKLNHYGGELDSLRQQIDRGDR